MLYKTLKTIDFSKEPPEFVQDKITKGILFWKKKPRVVSGMIYKTKNNKLFFIIDYKEHVLKESTLFRKCEK